MNVDPDARMLQVKGIDLTCAPPLHVVVQSFTQHITAMRLCSRQEIESVQIENVIMEENYFPDSNKRLQRRSECFIIFKTIRSAEYALGLEKIYLLLPMQHCQMILTRPKQTSVVRTTYRKIGALIQRIGDIGKEITALGAVREYSRPKLPSSFLDKSVFTEEIPKWKRARAAGQALDHHAYTPLRYCKMVDKKALQTRLDKLYNEECDALIQLREFQMDGVEFEF